MGLADEHDGGIDLLRKKLHWRAVEMDRQALPGEKRGVQRVEPRHRNAERRRPPGRGGNASPVPRRFAEVDEPPRLILELLDVCLPDLVRAGLGDGHLGGDVDEGRRFRVHRRQGVHGRGEPVGLESQRRAEPADEAGGRLETEGRAREGALLALEQARRVHRAHRPEVVPGGEAEDRGGGGVERGPFLELGAHLRQPALEQRVGVAKLHLAGRIVDRVIGAAGEQRIADVDLLAAVTNLEAVQRQHRPVR